MQIRLRELDLLEYHPLEEYVEQSILGEAAPAYFRRIKRLSAYHERLQGRERKIVR